MMLFPTLFGPAISVSWERFSKWSESPKHPRFRTTIPVSILGRALRPAPKILRLETSIPNLGTSPFFLMIGTHCRFEGCRETGFLSRCRKCLYMFCGAALHRQLGKVAVQVE